MGASSTSKLGTSSATASVVLAGGVRWDIRFSFSALGSRFSSAWELGLEPELATALSGLLLQGFLSSHLGSISFLSLLSLPACSGSPASLVGSSGGRKVSTLWGTARGAIRFSYSTGRSGAAGAQMLMNTMGAFCTSRRG